MERRAGELNAAGDGGRPSGAWTVAVGLLTILAALLRWRLMDQPVRYDEAVTWLRYVSEPLATGLSLYDFPNNHLFHTLLAHLSTALFGGGPRALRLPAFLAGVALVPATWWLGRAAAGREAALLGAATVTVSPVLLLFSTNARGYGLVVLAFVLMARTALVLRRRASPGHAAALAALAALAGWTLPAALYPAVAVGAWVLVPAAPGEAVRGVGRRAGSLAAAGVAAAAVTAALYAPVLRRSGLGSVVANRFVARRGTMEALEALPGFLVGVAEQWGRGLPRVVAGLLLLGAAVALVHEIGRWVRRAEDGRPPALFPVALATSTLFLLAHGRAPFPRVWLFLLPVFAIFAGRGLSVAARRAVGSAVPTAAAARRWLVGAAALFVAAGGAAGVLAGDPVRRWGLTGALPSGDRVARFLAERLDSGDAVGASLPSDAPLEYYFRRLGVPPGTVNGRAEPDGCIYLVVDRSRGQTPAGVLGPEPKYSPRLLRRFDGTEVWAAGPPARCGMGEEAPFSAGGGGTGHRPTGSTGTRRGPGGGGPDATAAG